MSACTNCGSSDIVTISFEVAGGAVYTFCRYCEKRSWESAGTPLDTTAVLGEAKHIEPARPRR
jgi:hypothetical protein